MKLLKLAALFALATVPLLIVKREKQKPAQTVDSDEIFEQELTAD
jgi:hypothetical protein